MRYLVKARVRPERVEALRRAIAEETLGVGSIAGDEYLRDIASARQLQGGEVCWIEICFCPTPLLEEGPYWEEYFELLSVKDAHAPSRCRDVSGEEPWACCECDCTKRLEARLEATGRRFCEVLAERHAADG